MTLIGNRSSTAILTQVIQALALMRAATDAAVHLHAWTSGVTLEDLTTPEPDGPGFDEPTAQAILDASADHFGLYQLYAKGSTDQTFPAGYIFSGAAVRLMGARSAS